MNVGYHLDDDQTGTVEVQRLKNSSVVNMRNSDGEISLFVHGFGLSTARNLRDALNQAIIYQTDTPLGRELKEVAS